MCERVTEVHVPLANLMMRRPIADAAVAIQISGHLQDGRGCSLDHMQGHAAACRARFRRCDVYLHTWSTLHPQTASWHDGPSSPHANSHARREINTSSEACMARIREALRPAATRVEKQPDPPSDEIGVGSLAPDGLPFNYSGTLTACGSQYACNWGPARLHGWQMSLAGMAQAAKLRADSGVRYDVAVRIRPDERVPWWDLLNQQGWSSHVRSWLQRLWNCVATFALALNDSAPSALFKHSAALPALFTTSTSPHTTPSTSPHETLLFDPRAALMACGPLPRDFKGGLNEDGCFFGTPATIDAVLGQFQSNYAAVYADVRRGANAGASVLYRAAGAQGMSSGDYWQAQELQLAHAIRLAGLQRARMCYGDEVEWRF